MPEMYQVVLQPEPYIAVETDDPKLHDSHIGALLLGTAKLTIDHGNVPLTEQQARCTALASLGLTNNTIGTLLYVTVDTVKTHLQHGYKKLDIDHREMYLPNLLGKEICAITYPGEPLHLTEAEVPIVTRAAAGYSNSRIGQDIGRAHGTVKSSIARIASRTGWCAREQIVMAAICYGEVDYKDVNALLDST